MVPTLIRDELFNGLKESCNSDTSLIQTMFRFVIVFFFLTAASLRISICCDNIFYYYEYKYFCLCTVADTFLIQQNKTP